MERVGVEAGRRWKKIVRWERGMLAEQVSERQEWKFVSSNTREKVGIGDMEAREKDFLH